MHQIGESPPGVTMAGTRRVDPLTPGGLRAVTRVLGTQDWLSCRDPPCRPSVRSRWKRRADNRPSVRST